MITREVNYELGVILKEIEDEDKYSYEIAQLVSDDCTLTFRSWSDYGRDFDLKDIRKWAYIKL